MTDPSGQRIAYTDGYKYRLEEPYYVQTGICPPVAIVTRYVKLLPSGYMAIAAGYCWDGATNAPDWRCALRSSLTHDALYQLIGLGLLDASFRKDADAVFQRMCAEDGMQGWMASIWHKAVQTFGPKGGSTPKVTKYAPR